MNTITGDITEAAWQAVIDHDADHDGRFVYAVTTTGVYCRPSCRARRPNRANVRCYADPDAARQAGFRPCRRCHPDGDDPRDVVVARACAYLDAHVDEPVTLTELGRQVGMSPTHLQRVFKARVGASPREYLLRARTAQFKTALRESPGGVLARAYDAGFGSNQAAYTATDSLLGMTPATYGAGGRGTTIRFASVSCSLGWVLVGMTQRGVCAVSIGDSVAALEETLRAEFPHATITRDERELHTLCRRIVAAVERGEAIDDVPIDVRGTAFQWSVWRALRAIPRGHTTTYQAIASEIGMPNAVRAVANACAANHVALLVPCHRAVRTDGGLGGYRWGVERKEALLEREYRYGFKTSSLNREH